MKVWGLGTTPLVEGPEAELFELLSAPKALIYR